MTMRFVKPRTLLLLCLLGIALRAAGQDALNQTIPDQHVTNLHGAELNLHGSELKISTNALERTLQARLFKSPDDKSPTGRYYIRGNAEKPCSVYAEDPHISFKSASGTDEARIWVHLKIHARLGKPVGDTCLGLALATESDVSFIPFADGERVGFRDARIEDLTQSRQLDFLLAPFLKGKIPSSLEVNAADLLRKTLTGSEDRTGYAITLDRLQIGTLEVRDDMLVVDVDADVTMK
jgi:hypothetical protein